jgi:hypothetical protein
MIQTLLKPLLIGCSVLISGTLVDTALHSGIFIRDAPAGVVRIQPVRPAAVARHTTRRVIHRTTVYVATLPPGCTTVVIEGTTLHLCGAIYYMPYDGQYIVVVID